MSYYMIVFTVIVVGSFTIAYIARSIPMHRPGGMGQPLPNPIGFLLPAMAFGVFSGLRNNMGDTFYYIHSYRLLDPDTMEPIRFELSGGIMYPFIQYLCRLRSPDPYLLIMITALIAVVPTVYIIYKYSCPYELGIALFVLTSYYSFSMNGIRQYAAAGILILGTKYMMSEKNSDFFKYLIFVFIAWLFHTSALIMIPIYFIVRRRSWTPFTLLILLGTVVATAAFDSLLPSFLGMLEDTVYGTYAENGWFTEGQEGGSDIIRVAVLTIPLILAYISREKLSYLHGRKWDILVNLSVINLAFYILSLYNWIFARLAIYTSIYVIIMMTYVITEALSKEQSKTVYLASLLLYSFYFYNVRYSVEPYASDLF
ncbi:MAG: EpsG family protein [Acutalibacteraceae bacterium]